MSDIDLDLSAVSLAKLRADNALTAFQSAQDVGDDLADLVGDPGLAGKVRDFAGNWDYNRGKLEEQLTVVGDWLQAIEETMTELDSSMAVDADGTP